MTATATTDREPLFHRKGDTYVPTAMTVGPWSPEALHGGPPTALLARAVEQEAASRGLQVSRLTVDLFRAVPMAPLQVAHRSCAKGGGSWPSRPPSSPAMSK